MLGRLLVGIVKGLVVGALVGFGLVKLGMAAPPAVIAFLAAAATGVLIGLVAGKPIWAKDAKIEAGMKAFVGALLGAGLMFAVRKWLTMPLPFAMGELAGPNASLNEAATSMGTIGGTAMTSLAAIAGVLGGFYEADNDPADESKDGKKAEAKSGGASAQRIAAQAGGEEDDEEQAAEESDKKQAKK